MARSAFYINVHVKVCALMITLVLFIIFYTQDAGLYLCLGANQAGRCTRGAAYRIGC